MKKLTRNLRDNGIDAFILALEVVNRISVRYRLEASAYLFCNAWELLLKAKLNADGSKIWYRKQRGKPRRSLSLSDCLNRLFKNARDPVRLNVETVSVLRDHATHLVIPVIPPDVFGLLQACCINYAAKLQEWFAVDLAERVPLGMMALVYDVDPARHSLDSPLVRRQTTAQSLEWLRQFQSSIREQAEGLKGRPELFHVPVSLKLALVKSPSKGDLVLRTGLQGQEALVVEVPKSPDRTHPYRQTELIGQVNRGLPQGVRVNQYDMQVVRKLYRIECNARYCYQPKFGTKQYSEELVAWLVKKGQKDRGFFEKARAKWKRQGSR